MSRKDVRFNAKYIKNTANKRKDDKVQGEEIGNSTITGKHIADGSITADKFAPGAVSTAGISDGSVTSAKLANGSVTSAKLADGSVTTAKLSDNAVTNQKRYNNIIFNVASNIQTNSNSQVRTYEVVYLNIGSHYSTSTHRFTAPIAGRYYFEWSTIKLDFSYGSVHRQYIRVNGSTGPMGGRHLRLSDSSNYGDGTCSAIIQLNANDYVDIYISSSYTGSYGSTNYTWFQGFFLG